MSANGYPACEVTKVFDEIALNIHEIAEWPLTKFKKHFQYNMSVHNGLVSMERLLEYREQIKNQWWAQKEEAWTYSI